MSFSITTSDSDLTAFWAARIGNLRRLKAALARSRSCWEALIRPTIRTDTGISDAPSWAYLAQAFELGDPRWASRIIFGFPIAGTMGQNRSPDTKHCNRKNPNQSGDKSILLQNASILFPNSPNSLKPQQRADVMGQISNEWEGGPFPHPQTMED